MNSNLSLQPNYDIQSLNTLSVPSVAEFFVTIKSDGDYAPLLSFLKEKKSPLLILGGGSNVLLPSFVAGIVAKIETKDRELVAETDTDIIMRFSAGENWHDIVMWSVENGFCGIENLALIPGSIGAAPIQNIGAYGVELESCCEYVDVIFLDSGKKSRLTREQCQFAYRDSIFKGELKDKVLITHVALKFAKEIKSKKEGADKSTKNSSLNLQYPALRSKLVEIHADIDHLSAEQVAHAVIEIRQSKLPDPQTIPNAGSFFKNPVVHADHLERIKQDYPDVVAYPTENNHFKLAAGWLIDRAGWKGKVVNNIAMHHQQALVLTNPESASTQQLLDFADKVCASIYKTFSVELEIEPRVFK
ncbi:MAG: UDP-N-acetylmuramate dehydrogenase [Cellvibrionaceae bacterium]